MTASLSGILSKGSESLQNSRIAIDVAGHNIANAHTEGYSRQAVNLETKPPVEYGMNIFGDGARVQSISRSHDKLLESQLRRESQNFGKTDTLVNGLKKIEGLFNPDLTATIRDKLVAFSSSLSELSNYPEEAATRINTIETGKAVAQAFNSAHANIAQIQTDSNLELKHNINNLNDKLRAIAQLNTEIRGMSAGMQGDANDLEDKRDILLKAVGEIIDINIYKDSNDQYTVRGPGECLLVEGSHSSSLDMDDAYTPNEMPAIRVSKFEQPAFIDITHQIHTGKMGALLEVRDKHAQGIRNNINILAKGFGEQFNSLHEQGYGVGDARTHTGLKFFTGLDEKGEAAQNIDLNLSIVSNPNAIAVAMSPDTPGDNVIANKMIKMFSQPAFGEKSLSITATYDKMIAQLGHDTVKATEDAKASKVVFDKLKSQHESVAGVSMDEEAANILKFQHLFNASSKIITTADEMYKTILELKR